MTDTSTPESTTDDAKAERLQEAQTIAYPSGSTRRSRTAPQDDPTLVVLFGATGDLSRRKLLCGLGYLAVSGLAPELRVIGTSLDDMTDDEFRAFAKKAIDELGARKLTAEQWEQFAPKLSYVNTSAGPAALAEAVATKEQELADADGPVPEVGLGGVGVEYPDTLLGQFARLERVVLHADHG